MRKRYLEFLTTPKRRKKLTGGLAHFQHWNPMYCVKIPPNQQHPPDILKLLMAKGAGPKCWVISEDSELDGREMDLEEALRRCIGWGMGTILSCVLGKLAYFEHEQDRYILQRK